MYGLDKDKISPMDSIGKEQATKAKEHSNVIELNLASTNLLVRQHQLFEPQPILQEEPLDEWATRLLNEMDKEQS